MKKGFFRTGKTDLTDDELILFDVLFDCYCPVKSLIRFKFKEYFNFTFAHNLNNKELENCLEDLQNRKLVKIKKGLHRQKPANFVSLIAKGGKLWEIERNPIWDKYCEGWTYFPFKQENKLLMEVVSPSLETLKKYVEVSKTLQRNGFDKNSKVKFEVEKRKSIVGLSWKRFPEIHIATIEGEYKESNEENTDWDYFYKNLDWWGNVYELNILQEKIL